MARHRVNIGEMINGTGDHSATTCPACGLEGGFVTDDAGTRWEGAFKVSNSWRAASKGRRRLRQCRFCDHAQNETVPEPVID